MRISNMNMVRGYLTHMNGSLKNLNDSNNKMNSQRKFSKASENVSDASRALRVRRLISDNEMYLTNVRDIKGRLAAAEDHVKDLSEKVQTATERMVQALNGVYSPSDREKIATEMENMQKEILQISNASYADKPLFAAAGGAAKGSPFEVAPVTGDLKFNGNTVSGITKDPATGQLMSGGVPIKYNSTNYLDIGLGIKVDMNGNSNQIDSNSAIPFSLSGIELFGYGEDADGVSRNIYTLFGQAADTMRANVLDTDKLGDQLTMLSEISDRLLVGLTNIGNRTQFIDDTESQLENQQLTLKDNQKSLEGVDVANEIIYNKQYEQSWMVTLQMGSKVLPTSLFDFLR